MASLPLCCSSCWKWEKKVSHSVTCVHTTITLVLRTSRIVHSTNYAFKVRAACLNLFWGALQVIHQLIILTPTVWILEKWNQRGLQVIPIIDNPHPLRSHVFLNRRESHKIAEIIRNEDTPQSVWVPTRQCVHMCVYLLFLDMGSRKCIMELFGKNIHILFNNEFKHLEIHSPSPHEYWSYFEWHRN